MIPQAHVDDVMARCARHCCVCRRRAPLHLQVHHIQHQADGGSDDLDNLIAVCVTCHIDVHAKTRFTRRFTDDELKKHRDTVYTLVKEGKLPVGDGTDVLNPVPDVARATCLSDAAVEILLHAAFDDSATVLVVRHMEASVLRCGTLEKEFQRGTDAREEARYKHALDELVEARCLEDSVTRSTSVFRVTHLGFVTADGLAAAGEARRFGVSV